MSLPRFGVDKPVPVNLLMIAVILAGLVSGLSLRREFFPEQKPEHVIITLPYPGATPEEIEQTLVLKVEQKLVGLDEIDEITAVISEGGGVLTAELREGVNPDKALDEVQRAIDSLLDLPAEAEKITVQLLEPRLPVIRVAVFGPLDEATLKQTIRRVRDDLRSLRDMGELLVEGVREYEIRVDVSAAALIEHGLSLPEVADAIGAWMVEAPGGSVRSAMDNIRVRTMGTAARAAAIREIVLRGDGEGGMLRVADIATVTDGFVDEQIDFTFNGQPAANLTVFGVSGQDIVRIAEMVRAYVDGARGSPYHRGLLERHERSPRYQAWALGRAYGEHMPAGMMVSTHTDLARFVEGRLELLARNAVYGGILVFLTLLLFLNWRVACWVGVGLVTALLGTLVLMAWLDITLNLLTMFGLIVVLGLLVDDAIVVAENIQARHDRGEPALTAAVAGTQRVLWPVTATVLTTIVAFLPLTFIQGNIGDLLGALPLVVACALTMSLIESLLILPSHMGHSLAKRDRSHPGHVISWVRRLERRRDHLLLDRIVPAYARLLALALRHRYVAACIALATLMVSLAMVKAGHVPFTFLPKTDAETIIVDVRLPIGSPVQRTQRFVRRIERAATAQDETLRIASVAGVSTNLDTGMAEAYAQHVAQVFIELKYVEQRQRDSHAVIDAIRAALRGHLHEVDRIRFSQVTGGPGGADIAIRVRGEDREQMRVVVDRLKDSLAGFDGVHEIDDDSDDSQPELRVSLLPGAAALGLTTADVARQVRGFLFGLDAHVFAEREEDIDVRVRLDEPTRQSLADIERIWIITPDGRAVPLGEVAQLTDAAAHAAIRRAHRQRAVTVTAATAPGLSPETIVPLLPLDQLRAEHPGIVIEFTGRQQQVIDAFATLPLGFAAAMVMIYVILAWLFSSYWQPIVVMLAIPFAVIGVVWGHLLLGYEMTFLSLIGFVALSGIVVNDSLILVEFHNAERHKGRDIRHALIRAGRARFRAIMMTTLTTVLGLMPLILEQSFQARFLIPMAIAIAFGLMATTVLILLALPCIMVIIDDAARGAHFLWHGRPRPTADAPDA